jgi:lipoprotein-releasing system ATP-binding protein
MSSRKKRAASLERDRDNNNEGDMPDSSLLLEMEKVCKVYEAPEGSEPLAVLDQVDLALNRGESLAVVGPSGSGKSTLLNIMGALDRPTSGEVRLAGRDLAQLTARELAAIRNEEVGFVFQLHHLLDQLNVIENVLVPTVVTKDRSTGAAAEERARSLLGRVGLAKRLFHRPAQLSGGERQRVALVRALINRPGLLLADEPTGSLDRAASSDLAELLKEVKNREGVALVVVTHSATVARSMDRVLTLCDGKLTPREETG